MVDKLEEVELDLLGNCIDDRGRPVDNGLPRTADDVAVLLCFCLAELERVSFRLKKSSGVGSVGDERSSGQDVEERGDIDGDCWVDGEEENSSGVRLSAVRVERASASSSWQRRMHISRWMASSISERSLMILSSSNMKV